MATTIMTIRMAILSENKLAEIRLNAMPITTDIDAAIKGSAKSLNTESMLPEAFKIK